MSQDFETFYAMAQKVVDAMVDEYHVPMILDQATISNTNKHGHPPHAASCLQVFYTCNATSGLVSNGHFLQRNHLEDKWPADWVDISLTAQLPECCCLRTTYDLTLFGGMASVFGVMNLQQPEVGPMCCGGRRRHPTVVIVVQCHCLTQMVPRWHTFNMVQQTPKTHCGLW